MFRVRAVHTVHAVRAARARGRGEAKLRGRARGIDPPGWPALAGGCHVDPPLLGPNQAKCFSPRRLAGCGRGCPAVVFH